MPRPLIDLKFLGNKQLQRTFRRLARTGGNKAAKAGANAALAKVAAQARKDVRKTSPAEGYLPELPQIAAKTIGKRIDKPRGATVYRSRVGFAVGIKGAKRFARLSPGRTSGKGIATANIHWFALGTSRRRSGGQGDLGRIKPSFIGILKTALRKSRRAAITAARKKIKQVIEREARKRSN